MPQLICVFVGKCCSNWFSLSLCVYLTLGGEWTELCEIGITKNACKCSISIYWLELSDCYNFDGFIGKFYRNWFLLGLCAHLILGLVFMTVATLLSKI